MNILLSIVLFVVGIFMGAYLARVRIDPNWTVAQEFEWWKNIFLDWWAR